MIKTIRALAVAALCSISSITAYAINYQLQDLTPRIIPAGGSFTGTFDLLSSGVIPTGYNPGAEHITGASAYFFLSDPTFTGAVVGGSEAITVALDGQFFAAAVNFISVFVGGNIVDLSLLADNSVNYTIRSASGSAVPTALSLAQLNFSTAPGAQERVPDGGTTMTLLGIGLVGMGCIRRRLAA